MKQHRGWAWASLACMALALYTGRKRVGRIPWGMRGGCRVPPASPTRFGYHEEHDEQHGRKERPMNINNVVFERSFGVSSQLTPSTMPEIAFAGRSNVGKSSLLNKLFNRKGLAKVSQTPGKTATINFFSCDGVRFVDLPGYGYAKVSKSDKSRWSELIEGYFNQDRDLALVVSLVDIRHEASDLDVNMIGFLQEAELPFAVVLTKADKLSRQQQMKQKAALKKQLKLGADVPLVVCSSEKGTGIDELRSLIKNSVR